MVLPAQAVPRSYKEDKRGSQVSSVRESVKKRVRWNRAAIQRGHERGSRRISNVRSRYHGKARKDLERAVVIFKV
jgi:hypothetical protein